MFRQARASLSAKESALVRALGRTLHVTPYILFRTAVAIVIQNYTGKHRVAFWANFLNRRHPGMDCMIGWCSNRHLIGVEISGSTTGYELSQRVAMSIRQARQHEALPLAALWNRIWRNLNRNDTAITFDYLPRQRGRLPGQRGAERLIEVVDVPRTQCIDLDIRVREEHSGFAVHAVYNCSRYDDRGVSRMLANVCDTASRLAADPNCQVSELA